MFKEYAYISHMTNIRNITNKYISKQSKDAWIRSYRNRKTMLETEAN